MTDTSAIVAGEIAEEVTRAAVSEALGSETPPESEPNLPSIVEAEVAVATAESAAALANMTAAAAELDAAERIRRFEEENASWRAGVGQEISVIQQQLLETMSALQSEISGLKDRLSSTQQQSMQAVETLAEVAPTALAENSPVVEDGAPVRGRRRWI